MSNSKLDITEKIDNKILDTIENPTIRAEVAKVLKLDEEVEIVGLIFKTQKYNMFKRLAGNREVNESNLKKLRESIDKNGYKKSQPIVVDENFNICDGQHREKIAEEKNLPVIFTIESSIEDSLKLTQDLNRNQKNWGLEDYVLSFKDQGNENYIEFVNFLEEEKINLSLGIWLLFRSRNGATQLKIRDGKLIFGKIEQKRVRNTLNLIREISNVIPSNLSEEKKIKRAILSDKIAVPLMVIMEEENYNHSRMIKQVKTMYRSIDTRSMAVAGDSLVAIYNHKYSKNSSNRLAAYDELSQKINNG